MIFPDFVIIEVKYTFSLVSNISRNDVDFVIIVDWHVGNVFEEIRIGCCNAFYFSFIPLSNSSTEVGALVLLFCTNEVVSTEHDEGIFEAYDCAAFWQLNLFLGAEFGNCFRHGGEF